MTGSEKQINYFNKIVAERIAEAEKFIAKITDDSLSDSQKRYYNELFGNKPQSKIEFYKNFVALFESAGHGINYCNFNIINAIADRYFNGYIEKRFKMSVQEYLEKLVKFIETNCSSYSYDLDYKSKFEEELRKSLKKNK